MCYSGVILLDTFDKNKQNFYFKRDLSIDEIDKVKKKIKTVNNDLNSLSFSNQSGSSKSFHDSEKKSKKIQ